MQKLVDRIESLTGEDPFYTMITRDEITLLVHLSDSWESRVDTLERDKIELLSRIAAQLNDIQKLNNDKRALLGQRSALRKLLCESEARRRRCSPETVAHSHGWVKLYSPAI